jgi:hypothetical protein
MKTASELLPHIVRITGQPEHTVKAVREHLAHGDVLPLSHGRGKNPEKFGSEQLGAWLIGLCLDVPHRALAKTTRQYLDLPGKNGSTAGHALASLIQSFKLSSDLEKVTAQAACKMRFVVDIGAVPRITLTIYSGEQIIHSVFGPQGPQWADENVRKSMTISGKVIHDLSVGLHHNIWNS